MLRARFVFHIQAKRPPRRRGASIGAPPERTQPPFPDHAAPTDVTGNLWDRRGPRRGMLPCSARGATSAQRAAPVELRPRRPLRTIRAMLLDTLVLALIAGFGFIGWRSGALLMALRLVALGVAAMLAAEASSPLGVPLARILDLSDLGGLALAFAGVFIAALIGLRLVARLVARLLAPTGTIVSGFDSLLGAAAGALTAGLVAWIAVSGLVIASARYGAEVPELDLTGSTAARVAARHSFFQFLQVPSVRSLQAVVRSATILANGDGTATPEDAERLAAYAVLARHPKAAFLEDPVVVRAILDGAWGTVLSDGRVWSFLADPDVASRLAALDALPAAP